MNSPRQAIVTRYLHCTNYKGSRIKAYCDRGSITINCPHELSGYERHAFAFRALLAKFHKEDGNETSWGPAESYVCGGLPDKLRDNYVFVSTR